MRSAWIALLLASVAFAGCSDDSADADPTETTTSTGTAGTTTETNTTTEAAGPGESDDGNETGDVNSPPTATLAASNQNGTAPLDVTFQLGGADEDGDSLAWTLDLDGDGAADEVGDVLPTTVNATYEAGTHNITLTVTDGRANTTANLTIEVVEATEEPAGPAQTASGTILTSPYGCLQNAYLNGPVAPYFVTFDIEPASYGLPFLATFETTVPSIENVAQFWVGTGTVAGTFTSDGGAVEGVVPEGAESVYLATCGGLEVDVFYQAGGF